MKKIIYLTLSLLLFSTFLKAQNYQCLRSDGNIYWFMNSNNYMRGIRIDSIVTSGTDTIFYPYHTFRMLNCTVYDTAGGSWVGGKVIEQSNGNFLFENTYNDTVIIRTQANLGDSWIFYNDSGSKFYMATVTATDTMTILGTPDSVKTITINAYNPTLDSTDTVNNFTLIISKTHGFVRVFDLFNFPYHSPLSTHVNSCDAYVQLLMQYGPGNQIFNLIPFHVPTQLEMFGFQTNDVFEYHIFTYDVCQCGTSIDYEGVEYDSITNRLDVDSTHSIVSLFNRYNEENYYCGLPDSIRHYTYWTAPDTLYLSNAPAVDMHLLPEEYGQSLSYYYYLPDGSFCNSTYKLTSTVTFQFENCDNTTDHKLGIGVTDSDFCQSPGGCPGTTGTDGPTYKQLIYYTKGDIPCGSFINLQLAINSLNMLQQELTIYPNPANNDVTIVATNSHMQYTASVINMLGQTVIANRPFISDLSIDVGALPAGVYNVNITSDNGFVENKKIVVLH